MELPNSHHLLQTILPTGKKGPMRIISLSTEKHGSRGGSITCWKETLAGSSLGAGSKDVSYLFISNHQLHCQDLPMGTGRK